MDEEKYWKVFVKTTDRFWRSTLEPVNSIQPLLCCKRNYMLVDFSSLKIPTAAI